MSMPGPTVHVDLIAFDNSGRVLLIRQDPGVPWSTPRVSLNAHERIPQAAQRAALETLRLRVATEKTLGCYHEPSADESTANKLSFAVTTTLSPAAHQQINTRDTDPELHWWEPSTLLGASAVSSTVKNYFSPTPWNKIV